MRLLERPIRWTVLTALGLVAACLAPHDAQAQDDAKEKEYRDRSGTVTVRLPSSFSATKPDMVPPERVAEWVGRFFTEDEQQRDSLVTISTVSDYQRAELAFSVKHAATPPVEGSVRKGDGFHEHCFRPTGSNAKLFWVRYVEHGGRLYMIEVGTNNPRYDIASKAIPKALDTFVVNRVPDGPKPDDDFVEHKFKGYKVLSDHDDKGIVKTAVGVVDDGWEMLDKVLPGKPYVSGDLELRIYKASGIYTRALERHVSSQIGKEAHYIGQYGLFYMTSDTGMAQWYNGVRTQIARARIERHMGGQVPVWLSDGLSWYANISAIGGKPGSAPKDQIALGQDKIGTSRSLEQWIKGTVEDLTDGQRTGYERWAWIQYLLHGKAPKDARKAFEDYLATLHLTGDAAAAAEKWNEVDFEKLHAGFKKWGAKWK